MEYKRTYRKEADGLVKDGWRAIRVGLTWSGELLASALRHRLAPASLLARVRASNDRSSGLVQVDG